MQDKIIEKLVEIKSKIDSLMTKDDLRSFQENVCASFDRQMELLKRLI